MTFEALVDVRLDKSIEVLVDGVWHPGELEAWRARSERAASGKAGERSRPQRGMSGCSSAAGQCD
jgi:hypothetical protein